jgi:2,6-dihydroxypyridine 3-monooxygenase
LVLRDAGATVDVYERSPARLHDLGAGIVLHPATVQYPLRHGLCDLDEISSPARRVRYLDRGGVIVQERPYRYRLTSYDTLYRVLLDAFGRRLSPGPGAGGLRPRRGPRGGTIRRRPHRGM